jgi:hypothetical protein
MENLKRIIRKLDHIANLNKEKFEYDIKVKYQSLTSELSFSFRCIEIGDGHTLIIREVKCLADIDIKDIDIEEMCTDFGFEYDYYFS